MNPRERKPWEWMDDPNLRAVKAARAKSQLVDELLSMQIYWGLMDRLSHQLGYPVNRGPDIGEM